ncbi:CD209 antigen-like protein A [Melanotaenia boesemani]|uniref:CD209 antigen-like protein A n=1 Tax=Melanotaenia boesemani TaxID=1250792 RepID=UPI001C03D5DF|nr:CD209 antigen-like protein A [Melanotaenia boesemani]
MEEIYANIEHDKHVCPVSATDHRGSSSSKRRVYLGVILSVALLSVCLLAGLIVLGICYHNSGESVADLFAINNNLSKHLQTSDNKISALTEEINQLKANLTQMTEELNTVKVSKRNRTCPAGWIRFGCSCYLLSSKSGSWDKGREDCRGQGADLVVIDSAEVQTFLSTLTKKPTWIGLNDKENEGIWKWVDGSPLNLTYWANKQPDNGNRDSRYGEEDCAQIIKDGGTSWNDIKCTDSSEWICEKFLF